jgi:HK97 family phage portal protein
MSEKRTITWDSVFQKGQDQAANSGVTVNESTALGLSAVWCGVRTISQDVGTLPPILYRESGAVRTPARTHPLFRLLRDTPNYEQTRPVFFETLQAHAILWGNCFAEIERDNAGTPLNLWIIHPSRVTLKRRVTGGLYYEIENDGGPPAKIEPENVLHVPGLSPDGSVGYKLLAVARETIGFGVATQQYGTSFFANSARPSGALKSAGELSDPARENLRKSWAQLYSGTKNTGKVAILEEGLEFTPFQLTNEQSQYTEILQYFVYEIARLLNVQPTKLYDLQKATWGNLTELNRDYLTTTLRPWLVKYEAEMERKLLRLDERDGMYIEFDTKQLLRADTATRYASYSVGISAGFLTVDEVRAEENLPPLPEPEPEPEPEPVVVAQEQPQDPAPVTQENNGPEGNPVDQQQA